MTRKWKTGLKWRSDDEHFHGGGAIHRESRPVSPSGGRSTPRSMRSFRLPARSGAADTQTAWAALMKEDRRRAAGGSEPPRMRRKLQRLEPGLDASPGRHLDGRRSVASDIEGDVAGGTKIRRNEE